MPNCIDAKTYWRQSVSAPKLIGAKKSAPKLSAIKRLDAKTLAPKRSNLTLLISEQIRGTKLVTEKNILQIILSYSLTKKISRQTIEVYCKTATVRYGKTKIN